MNVKYYILNGVYTAGKDTFASYCKGYEDYLIHVMQFSSVDWIKMKAKQLGWDGNKDEKGRNLLTSSGRRRDSNGRNLHPSGTPGPRRACRLRDFRQCGSP